MGSSYRVNGNTRWMTTGSGANTYYPTGVMMGVINAALTMSGQTDSRTTTNTLSWYAINGRDPISMRWGAIIKRIAIFTPSAAAGAVAIQSHAGTAFTPSFDGTVVATHDFADGWAILGGWRVVTTGAPGAIIGIVYDLIEP
jgi:hypothetical protein